MAREPIASFYFALVIVRKGDQFLLVHERKHGERWYLPAGRVEPGESWEDAARRETLEEAGIPIILEGILRIEHTPGPDATARVRVLYLARPADDTVPKRVADAESLGAAWVRLHELDAHPLRGAEVRELFEWVAGGARAVPLSLVARENQPLPR